MINAGGELISRRLPGLRRVLCPFIRRPDIRLKEAVLQGHFHHEKHNELLDPRSCLVDDVDTLSAYRAIQSPYELYTAVVRNLLNE